MPKFFFLLLFVCVSVSFAASAEMAAQGSNMLGMIKTVIGNLFLKLLPVWILLALLPVFKYVIKKGLDNADDRRMEKAGYERYQPDKRTIRGKHYRLKRGGS